VANKNKQFIMAKRTYKEAFSFVSSSPTHSSLVLTMDPTAPPPPRSTTPDQRYPRTKLADTPNKFAGTFAPSSQPVGSTQRALQESLTGNVVFANEAIVDELFQPAKVDDQVVLDILAEINDDKPLKTARDSVLSSKLAETRKYKFLVRRRTLSLL
jgi:hypothetical protein